MKNYHRIVFGKSLRAAIVAAASLPLIVSTSASAQQADAAAASEDTVKLEAFTVTGSYLPLTAEVSASPVVVIERAKIGQTGATDALRLLKSLTPLFSGNGNVGQEVNNGGSGRTFVALRNLTTLVLLNGRRTSADLSNVPVAMIERVEILKDSASTIYGSDAIGGVINFILRKNYNGFETGARMSSDPKGDYQTKEAWVMGGVSLPDGYITIGASYFENTQLGTLARPISTLSLEALAALGANPANPPNYFSGSFSGRLNNDVLAGAPEMVGHPGFNAAIRSTPGRATPNDAPLTLAQLEAAGIYVPLNAANGFSTTNLLNTSLFNNALVVPTRRQQFVANGSKELFGKNLEVFGDFFYSNTRNGGTVLAPAPLAGLAANTLTIPANNPFNVFGVTLGVGQAAGAPNPRLRLEELGKRFTDFEFFATRTVIGLRGEINDRYKWETGFNYFKVDSSQLTGGGGIAAVMNQAMTPLLAAGGTQYVRNAQGQYLSVLTDAAGNNLPIFNYFALPGFNDPRTLAAIVTDLFRTTFVDQRSVDFVLTGRPFALPAGDFSFATGFESRRDRLSNHADSNFTTGGALGFNRVTGFPGGVRSTRSGFFEVQAPLVSPKMSLPLVHEASLTAAIREEHLNPGGKAKTPKFGLRWLPFDNQLVIRGTWARGFIAPSITALFGPPAGNSPTVTVPLSVTGGTGPGGAAANPTFVTGQFVPAVQNSNPNLEASRSLSYTAGFVYSPKQLKGLSVSADYYHIKQDKQGGFDFNFIVRDINARGSASPFAAGLVFVDGSRVTTTNTNQITSTNVGTLNVFTNPLGDQTTDGIDFTIDYKFQTESFGFFNFGANANVIFNYLFRNTPADRYAQYARNFTDSSNGLGASNGNLPSYVLKPYLNWAYKDLKVSLSATFLPEVTAPGSLFGGATAVNNQRANGLAYTIPRYHTFDLSATYAVPNFGKNWLKGITLTAGAINLLDKQAPFVPGGGSDQSESNTNKSTYDIIGRQIFVELKKTF